MFQKYFPTLFWPATQAKKFRHSFHPSKELLTHFENTAITNKFHSGLLQSQLLTELYVTEFWTLPQPVSCCLLAYFQ